ncbi:MAG: HlyC/CorC family transporter [Desulfovibrio sp.]|jgi:putative hemolysin|nr:HlyC/CorC family transporter [Desulfovibrio sp.]MBI4959815.1 HlyC/CorC family transporter [Desulfovibrio sp.]
MLAFILQSLTVFALILLNGFFAAAEMAVLTSRKPRLSQMAAKGHPGARTALQLAEKPEGFLAALQIGITLLTILSGAYGEASLASYVQSALERIPLLAAYAKPVGFGLVVAGITLVSLIAGELVPKRLAIARPEAIAVRVSRPMALLLRLSAPIVWLLSVSTRLVMRLLRVSEQSGSHVSEEEIKLLVRQAATAGVLEEAERDMMERVMTLGDRPVGTLMTHRSKIVCLDLEHPDSIPEIIRAMPFNRFPVVRGGLENLIGVAEAKDLLAVNVCLNALDVLPVLLQPPHVLETTTTFKLMEQLKLSGQTLAVVVDEFGAVQGLVTFTDILRAIVGDLVLPDDTHEPRIAERKDGSLLIDGMTPVSEVFERLDQEAPEGDFQTLAGFVLHRLGRIPAVAEGFDHGCCHFEVVDMDGRRVDRVLVRKLSSAPEKA